MSDDLKAKSIYDLIILHAELLRRRDYQGARVVADELIARGYKFHCQMRRGRCPIHGGKP